MGFFLRLNHAPEVVDRPTDGSHGDHEADCNRQNCTELGKKITGKTGHLRNHGGREGCIHDRKWAIFNQGTALVLFSNQQNTLLDRLDSLDHISLSCTYRAVDRELILTYSRNPNLSGTRS